MLFYLYLASLIFGGSLLAFSLIAGHDSDADAHGDLDAHGDFDADHSLDGADSFDVDHSLDAGGDALDPVDVSHDGALEHADGVADAVKLVSFRNIIYFLAFFGLTGTVLDLFAAPYYLAFGSSVGMGGFAAALGYQFMKYLKKTESGEMINIYNLKGHSAKVVVNVSKVRRGKICVEAGDQTHEILAKASSIAKKDVFERGEQVLIIEVKDTTAFVVQADYLSL